MRSRDTTVTRDSGRSSEIFYKHGIVNTNMGDWITTALESAKKHYVADCRVTTSTYAVSSNSPLPKMARSPEYL